MRKAAKIVGSVVVGVLVILGAAAGLLWLGSPGTPRPLVDATGRPIPGALSEKVFLDVNGARQGMFIKGRDPRNPILLHLHGGMPETFLTDRYPTGLEDRFTIVWWEQRGSGISYDPAVSPSTLSLDQLVADTVVVTDYLRRRFGKDRIYLMGHSGGSFVAVHAAARYPDRFAAYVGVAQMSNQLASEVEAYREMLSEYRRRGSRWMVARLEATPVTLEGGVPESYQLLRDVAMHELGVGTTRRMRSLVSGLLVPSLTFPEYTVREKLHLWTGKARSGIAALWPTFVRTDLSSTLTRFRIPVYFLHGAYDRTCSYRVARKYYGDVEAPVKGFYTFADSAHSPTFEEPARVRQILEEDVLQGRAKLADP